MTTYSTPGVYIEEVAVFPPSVAPVATAIPAFIGFTEKAEDRERTDLTKTPVRLTSLKEFEEYFGKPPIEQLKINVTKRTTATDTLIGTAVAWDGTPPSLPTRLLHYSLQLYFQNGGGPCYVYSIGLHGTAPTPQLFVDAINALGAEDEPTLLVFPDAVLLADDAEHGSVVDAALANCNKLQDRFTIADVRSAVIGGTDTNAKVSTNFRSKVTTNTADVLKYGAAYFPYVETLIPFRFEDASVTMTKFSTIKLKADGTTQPPADQAGKKVDDAGLKLKTTDTAVYGAIQAFLSKARVTLPPSGAVAGVCAKVDRSRGVWKAPANVGLNLVLGPSVNVTNDLQDGLNIDATTGKSVNAIRSFYGRGTLVWGGRTLAGNDNEWRYVSVRRFANFVEESVKKAVAAFVFEPNDANTWVRVRSMIENFLINQWRDGALMGAKPEHAFRVVVGLGQTMTAQDILDGYMIVEVHLAIVRPAEFIVLRFMQKMPES